MQEWQKPVKAMCRSLHAIPFINADSLVRYLQISGYTVVGFNAEEQTILCIYQSWGEAFNIYYEIEECSVYVSGCEFGHEMKGD